LARPVYSTELGSWPSLTAGSSVSFSGSAYPSVLVTA